MAALVTVLLVALQFGQSASGELRITVRDSSGLAVQCRETLVSDANDISEQINTGTDGLSVAKRLPFQYRIAINQPGFAPYDARVEVDSVLPRQVSVTLTPVAIQAMPTMCTA
jgi:hypothetical protein